MEVVENPDVDSFRAAVQSVYDAYPDYADYIKRIQDALKVISQLFDFKVRC